MKRRNTRGAVSRTSTIAGPASACARLGWPIFWVRVLLIGLLVALISCRSIELSNPSDQKDLFAPATEFQTPSQIRSPELMDSASEEWQNFENLRVFWVNSYQEDDPWSMQLRTGILETLARAGYSLADKTLAFEAFHIEGTYYDLPDILPITERAMTAIEAFGPDVVVVSDEEAIRALVPRISNFGLPIIFCGLNGSPQDEYLNHPNVTGVLERPHLLQTIRVAQDFLAIDTQDPDVGEPRYLILSDGSLSGQVSAAVIHDVIYNESTGARVVPPVDVLVSSQWEDWQTLFLQASERSAETGDPGLDFVLVLHYHTIKGKTEERDLATTSTSNGPYLSPHEVMSWILENSPVPIFGLWDFAISDGAVAGLVISGYDQGAAAADIAVQIIRGTDIASIEVRAPSRNLLAMNLAAAQAWGLQIPIQFAMAARVYRTLPIDLSRFDSDRSDIRHMQGGQ